ncbi:hypothetical protein HDU97_006989 [Phlyctochytrium planicorne]|nr:hypothetical protein HDU97_006989 [Phlyctochytrium planicorne]
MLMLRASEPSLKAPECLEEHLGSALSRRSKMGLTRHLDMVASDLIDFSSNDYLGLARHPEVQKRFLQALENIHRSDALQAKSEYRHAAPTMGSTGSRLLSGNSSEALSLEAMLAKFHRGPSALLFNSGYDANVGIFSCVPPEGSTVIYDELIHASVHDGFRRSRAASIRSFKHNDLESLRAVLKEEMDRIEKQAGMLSIVSTSSVKRKSSPLAHPGIIIAVESIYSMDGDEAPLRSIVELAESYGKQGGGIRIIVDEAHSTGVRGVGGRGLVVDLGLEKRIFARLHTFGKAVGAHGAVVIGPSVLRSFLINYARSLIYSTSLPLHSLIAIRCSYEVMEEEANQLQSRLAYLIQYFQDVMAQMAFPKGVYLLPSSTPIQGIVVPGNARVTAVSAYLRTKAGIDCRPIRSPTVPSGLERLRVCLHAHNSTEDISKLANEIVKACSSLLLEAKL